MSPNSEVYDLLQQIYDRLTQMQAENQELRAIRKLERETAELQQRETAELQQNQTTESNHKQIENPDLRVKQKEKDDRSAWVTKKNKADDYEAEEYHYASRGDFVEHVVCESQMYETLVARDSVKGGYHKAHKKVSADAMHSYTSLALKYLGVRKIHVKRRYHKARRKKSGGDDSVFQTMNKPRRDLVKALKSYGMFGGSSFGDRLVNRKAQRSLVNQCNYRVRRQRSMKQLTTIAKPQGVLQSAKNLVYTNEKQPRSVPWIGGGIGVYKQGGTRFKKLSGSGHGEFTELVKALNYRTHKFWVTYHGLEIEALPLFKKLNGHRRGNIKIMIGKQPSEFSMANRVLEPGRLLGQSGQRVGVGEYYGRDRALSLLIQWMSLEWIMKWDVKESCDGSKGGIKRLKLPFSLDVDCEKRLDWLHFCLCENRIGTRMYRLKIYGCECNKKMMLLTYHGLEVHKNSGFKEFISVLWDIYGGAIGGANSKHELSNRHVSKHVTEDENDTFGFINPDYKGCLLIGLNVAEFLGCKTLGEEILVTGHKMQRSHDMFLNCGSCENQSPVSKHMGKDTVLSWLIEEKQCMIQFHGLKGPKRRINDLENACRKLNFEALTSLLQNKRYLSFHLEDKMRLLEGSNSKYGGLVYDIEKKKLMNMEDDDKKDKNNFSGYVRVRLCVAMEEYVVRWTHLVGTYFYEFKSKEWLRIGQGVQRALESSTSSIKLLWLVRICFLYYDDLCSITTSSLLDCCVVKGPQVMISNCHLMEKRDNKWEEKAKTRGKEMETLEIKEKSLEINKWTLIANIEDAARKIMFSDSRIGKLEKGFAGSLTYEVFHIQRPPELLCQIECSVSFITLRTR